MQAANPIPERLLPLPDVINLVGMRRAWIYNQVMAGAFPAPLKIGRNSRWKQSEIAEWIGKQGRP